MPKPIIVDTFDSGIYCVHCKIVNLHHVQKIDENGNGQSIRYYGICAICRNASNFNEEDFLDDSKREEYLKNRALGHVTNIELSDMYWKTENEFMTNFHVKEIRESSYEKLQTIKDEIQYRHEKNLM